MSSSPIMDVIATKVPRPLVRACSSPAKVKSSAVMVMSIRAV